MGSPMSVERWGTLSVKDHLDAQAWRQTCCSTIGWFFRFPRVQVSRTLEGRELGSGSARGAH